MREIIETVLLHIRAIWHYRWYALIASWLICVAGWVYVLVLPDMYQASARVYVETNSVLRPLLQDMTVQTDVLNEVQLMTNALLSRPTLERLTEETGLGKRAENEDEREQLINQLKERISIRKDRDGDNLYWIEYMDAEPAMAKNLVTTLLGGFVENIQGSSKSDNTRAKDFLDEQIAEYDKRLEEAENRLKDFKLENIGNMPDEQGDYYQRLQTAKQELERVDLDLREAEQSLAELNRQVAGEEPTFGFTDMQLENNETRALDMRINELQSRLDELQLQYTDQHPDVAQIRQQIANLKRQKRRIVDDLAKFGTTKRAEQNPVFQQLENARGAKAAEVAALRVRRQEYQQRVEELEKMVDKIPAVEAELAKLNRDYNVIKEQYEALLKRRESAKLSSDVDRITDDVQFKVIDPPRVPTKPAWPPRFIFHTLVLIVALGAGVGFGYLMSQIIPVYYTGHELSATGLPLLGVVSLHMNDAMVGQKQTRLKQFIGAGSGLFCAYVAVLLI